MSDSIPCRRRAQEARKPQRDMPIGMLASLAICTVLYIGVAIVLTGIVPYGRLNVPDPLAVGIDATGVKWLSPFIKVSALFGLFSTMLGDDAGTDAHLFHDESRLRCSENYSVACIRIPDAPSEHGGDGGGRCARCRLHAHRQASRNSRALARCSRLSWCALA
jgi:hypothetical protein